MKRESIEDYTAVTECGGERMFCPYGTVRWVAANLIGWIIILLFVVLLWMGFGELRILLAFALSIWLAKLIVTIPTVDYPRLHNIITEQEGKELAKEYEIGTLKRWGGNDCAGGVWCEARQRGNDCVGGVWCEARHVA